MGGYAARWSSNFHSVLLYIQGHFFLASALGFQVTGTLKGASWLLKFRSVEPLRAYISPKLHG